MLASVPNPVRNRDGLTIFTTDLEVLLDSIRPATVDRWYPEEPRLRARSRSRIRTIRSWLTRNSKLPGYHRPDLVNELATYVEKTQPDVILFNHILTAWMMPRLSFDVPKVYVAHNAEYVSSKSAARFARGLIRIEETLEAIGKRKLERQILDASDGLIVLSHSDAERLANLSSRAARLPTAVIPPSFEKKRAFTKGKSNSVLLLGSFEWMPKQANARWLAREVFPHVRRKLPESQLVIAGHRAELLDDLGTLPWVDLRPDPPEVASLWAEAAVCAVPERQFGGVKLKVVEAVAYGVPVVSTTAGVEGTHLVRGRSVLVADKPRAFATHLVDVMASERSASALSANATKDMATYPNADEKCRRLTELINLVV